MTLSNANVYDDDADAYVDREITDTSGADLTFDPTIAVGDGAYEITGTWQGDVASTRVLRIPVANLEAGTHRLYLSIPGSNDLDLGYVNVITRR